MSSIPQNVRFSIRMIFRQPAFSLAALVALGLGIGGTSAMFTVLNGLVLKPLLIAQPGEVVGVYSRNALRPGEYRGFSYAELEDLREHNSVFSSLTANDLALVGLTEDNRTRRTFANLVPANYFDTFGAPLFRGRPFSAAEEKPGAQIPSAIVSYAYWKKRGSPPDLLGHELQINGHIYSIIGITAQGFTGATAALSPELYLPMGMYDSVSNDFEGKVRPLDDPTNHPLLPIARLNHGLSLEAANAGLVDSARRMASAYPAEEKDRQFIVAPLSRFSVSTSPQNDQSATFPIVLLMGMAGIVLVIASLNVANMMLARATARRRETAVRMALGARRSSIVQQLFTEGMVLSLAGGALGLFLSYAGCRLLLSSMAAVSPFDLAFSAAPDWRVVAATAVFCTFSALIFTLAPARSFAEAEIVSAIKTGEAGLNVAAGRFFTRRNLLVASQISLSLMLLTAAGLFLQSSLRAARVQPGFDLQNTLVLEVDPRLAGYDEMRGRQLYATLLQRMRELPGVQSAALGATVPFGMFELDRSVQRADAPDGKTGTANQLWCRSNIVSAGYFTVLGIPMLEGREFRGDETQPKAAPVVVIDQLTARRLWPNGNAIGQHLTLLPDGQTHGITQAEVIGVAGSIQESIFGEALQPHVYLPFGQEYQSDMNIHLRAGRHDAKLLEDIRRRAYEVDPRLPVLALNTMTSHLESSVELWLVRTGARLFLVFGATALVLAMVGLYGLRAYMVARRTREIGIRMALGARPGDAQWLFLKEGMVLMSAAAAVGLLLSALVGRLLASLLYRMSGFDLPVLAGCTAALAAVSLLACYIPALKASHVDPMVALRQE
ncbi:MAG: ABC transporter permease [Acidobacteria bacterium]|nr:ABC transporter permease [Acidobacteriota bacterium]